MTTKPINQTIKNIYDIISTINTDPNANKKISILTIKNRGNSVNIDVICSNENYSDLTVDENCPELSDNENYSDLSNVCYIETITLNVTTYFMQDTATFVDKIMDLLVIKPFEKLHIMCLDIYQNHFDAVTQIVKCNKYLKTIHYEKIKSMNGDCTLLLQEISKNKNITELHLEADFSFAPDKLHEFTNIKKASYFAVNSVIKKFISQESMLEDLTLDFRTIENLDDLFWNITSTDIIKTLNIKYICLIDSTINPLVDYIKNTQTLKKLSIHIILAESNSLYIFFKKISECISLEELNVEFCYGISMLKSLLEAVDNSQNLNNVSVIYNDFCNECRLKNESDPISRLNIYNKIAEIIENNIDINIDIKDRNSSKRLMWENNSEKKVIKKIESFLERNKKIYRERSFKKIKSIQYD